MLDYISCVTSNPYLFLSDEKIKWESLPMSKLNEFFPPNHACCHLFSCVEKMKDALLRSFLPFSSSALYTEGISYLKVHMYMIILAINNEEL